jgi:hypothetical protein
MVDQYILNKLGSLFPRTIETVLHKDLETGSRTIVLLGSRQVGKTSLMYRLIDHLLNTRNITPSMIEYLDLEFPQILSQVSGLFGKDFLDFLRARGIDTSDTCYVFIDEVHYLREPSSFIKTINDHFPNIRLIVSGSSSLQIQKKFKDSLTGRKSIVNVNPLDFSEYLSFRKSDLVLRKSGLSLQSVAENGTLPDLSELRFLGDEFRREYDEFSVFGGYPGTAVLQTHEEKTRLLA